MRGRAVLVLLAACLTSACGVSADDRLEAVAEELRAAAAAPGAIIGVQLASGERIVAASGTADVESGRPIRAEDAYFLGSVSKTYTAVAALRLVETGGLSLDDRLSRFLPGFPRGDDVTVRHLLDHTSGLKDFYSYLYFRPDREEMVELVTREWTRDELLELSARFGYWFDPGTDWSYSNTNYYLLGVIVEEIGGRTLVDAYREAIYTPLGLERTWLSRHEPAAAALEVTGYMGPVDGWAHSQMFGELGPTTNLDRSPVEWGAGGVAATAADALGFMSALIQGDLLDAESLELMTAFRDTPTLGVTVPGEPIAIAPDGYGLGLVRLERPMATFVGHGGLFTGHTAGLWHLPACGVTVSLYFNRGFVGQRSALDRILAVLPEIEPSTEACVYSVASG